MVQNANPIGGEGGATASFFCAPWFGEQNIEGEFGKTNGTYGFRALVKTNQTNPSIGNINIETTAVYPGSQQEPIRVGILAEASGLAGPTHPNDLIVIVRTTAASTTVSNAFLVIGAAEPFTRVATAVGAKSWS